MARTTVGLLSSLTVLVSVAWSQSLPGVRFYPDDPIQVDDDQLDSPPVHADEQGQWYDFVSNQFGDPGDDDEGIALNTNTLGQVPDSSWFTNRLGERVIGPDEAARGSVRERVPDGGWTIIGRPGAGVTLKFTIEAADGSRYLLKFDPTEMPGAITGSEVIGSRLFHLLGYFTPENTLVKVDLSKLEISPAATFVDDRGYERPLRWEDVNEWMRDTPHEADGSIRAVASRWIAGEPVGPFRYVGTRPDDLNDIYPHQRRRELRGLRVFSAWLNHDDSRSLNSGDFYVEHEGRHFVRHYLMDFGSTLGSASIYVQARRGGYEYFVEGGKILKSIFTLGLWERDWAKVYYPQPYGAGRFEADYFEPWKWKPNYPNPSFDRMDAADAFWAASLLAQVTDEQIAAIVDEAGLGDGRDYMLDVLLRRRDKVVAYWISRTNPVDAFTVSGSGDDLMLAFDNAAVRVGAAAPGGHYSVSWASLDNTSGTETAVGSSVTATQASVNVPVGAWGPADPAGLRYAIARIETLHDRFPQWRDAVTVTLRRSSASGVGVVGVERPTTALDYRPDPHLR